MREFLHVDDLVAAVRFVLENQMEHYLYNVGTGKDVKFIRELANLVSEVTEFKGHVTWDSSKPDGTLGSCWMLQD